MTHQAAVPGALIRLTNTVTKNLFYAMATIAHLNQASRFEGSVRGKEGFTQKNEWTQVIVGNWTRTINPSTLVTVYGAWRNEPFENTPSLGNVPFSIPIQGITQQAPFEGPLSITIGSNGAGKDFKHS